MDCAPGEDKYILLDSKLTATKFIFNRIIDGYKIYFYFEQLRTIFEILFQNIIYTIIKNMPLVCNEEAYTCM